MRWWGRAWQSGVEESAFGDSELKTGRRIARSGLVGAIELGRGEYVASVTDGEHLHRVNGSVRLLDAEAMATFVDVVAAEAGRIGALVAGDIPRRLAEDAEEAGVELVPWSGELGFTCTCEPWADPCAHAIAVATQVGWLLDADPMLLLTLRGTTRQQLLESLNALGEAPSPEVDLGVEEVDLSVDLAVAQEAALRAERLLVELGH